MGSEIFGESRLRHGHDESGFNCAGAEKLVVADAHIPAQNDGGESWSNGP